MRLNHRSFEMLNFFVVALRRSSEQTQAHPSQAPPPSTSVLYPPSSSKHNHISHRTTTGLIMTEETKTATAPTSTSGQASTGPHPLQFKWALWHDVMVSKQTAYAANLRQIAKFETVEEFWALFNNLKEPSQLKQGHMYNLFKDGIEPKWEDPQNSAGGEWRLALPPRSIKQIDDYWVNTVLTVIGEGFLPEESDDISGLVVNIKKGSIRISIWTKTALDESLQMRIGARWKETANITAPMEYISFKDSLVNVHSSKRSARYAIQ